MEAQDFFYKTIFPANYVQSTKYQQIQNQNTQETPRPGVRGAWRRGERWWEGEAQREHKNTHTQNT